MANSTILGILLIAQTQNNKYVTANDATIQLERSIQRIFEDTTMSANSVANTLTLTEADFTSNGIFRVSGGNAAMTLETVETVDGNAVDRLFCVHNNDTTYTITIQSDTTPGNTVDVAPGQTQLLYQDSTNIYSMAQPGLDDASGAPYDIGMFFPGAPTASQIMLKFVATRAYELADDFAGSQGEVETNPASSWVGDVHIAGSSVGSVTISTGGAYTFATTGGTVEAVAIGEALELIGPGSADGSIADIAVTFKGTRTGS